MRLLVLKNNTEGMSVSKNGSMEVHIVDPSLLDGEMMGSFESPDLVIVCKELETESQRRSLKFAYRVTKYKEGNLSKVLLA